MARVYPLFSSSKGNSTYIGDEKSGILIDAGVSCKRIVSALENNNISINAVKGIFITHEHSDHICGLKTLTNKYKIPIISSGETLFELMRNEIISKECESYAINNKYVRLADLEVTSFSTSHDAVESCGFLVKTKDNKKICFATDLGEITPIVTENMKGSDLVFIEANYDEKMLLSGAYPQFLKKRISSKYGHLSNEDCALQVEYLLHNGTKRIILGHLSQENNTPSTAENAVLAKLTDFERDKDYSLLVAPVVSNGEVVVL